MLRCLLDSDATGHKDGRFLCRLHFGKVLNVFLMRCDMRYEVYDGNRLKALCVSTDPETPNGDGCNY